MEVFSKYFTRLVAGNAPQVFPGLNRPVSNPGNYHILVGEMQKIAHDVDQAVKIAESIETGTEDIFREFDLSTFMEHFKLDALEKTLLALAFKLGTRSDLKTKGTPPISSSPYFKLTTLASGRHSFHQLRHVHGYSLPSRPRRSRRSNSPVRRRYNRSVFAVSSTEFQRLVQARFAKLRDQALPGNGSSTAVRSACGFRHRKSLGRSAWQCTGKIHPEDRVRSYTRRGDLRVLSAEPPQ